MGTIVATPDASRRLGDFSLLEELTEQEKRAIEQRCHKRTYSRNETILDKGSQSREVFFVLKGSVSVITFSPAGREVTLAAVKAGDFFGELALIEEHGRTATVIAETDLTCLLISAWEFKASLEEHPEMAIPMLKAIIGRLHRQERHGN